MTALAVVNEGSSHFVTVSFVDESGAPVVPAEVTVRIDDETSGRAIRPPTPVDPASEIELEVTPAENALVSSARSQEARVVTIDAPYGPGGAKRITGEYRYLVRNLRFRA